MRVPKLKDPKFMAGVTWEGKQGALTPSGEWQMFIAGWDAWLRYIDKLSFLES